MQLSHSNIPVKEDGLKFYLKTDKETRVSIKIIADGVVKGYFKINGNEINSMTLAPGVYHPQVNWQDINTLSGNVAIQYHIIAPTTAPLAENTVYIDELMYTQLNETRTAADIAQTITSIQQPIKDETVLTLPSVPTGFGIKILSTDSPSVITTAGKIYPQAQEKTVVLVLQVNRRLVVANTQPITVIVPARSRDNLLDSGAETFETANNESLMRFWNTASISSSSGTLSLSLSENGGSSDSKSMLIDTVLYYNYSIANFSKMIEKQKDGLTMRVDLRSLKMGDTTFTIAIYQGEKVKGYLINDKLEPGIYYPVLWWDDIELTDPLTGGDISLRISMKCDKAHAQDGMAYAEKIALYLDDIMFATKSSTTPAQIAAGITGIEAPEKDEKNLHWPQVPNGYWISIKSTSNPSIIAKTGKLYPVKADVRVTLVFTVTAPGGESADTVPISVIVPGRTFYAPDVSGIGQYTVEDFERYTNTDDLKQVFSIIDPAENKVIDLEVSSPVSGEKSLKIDFISQTTPISLFSGRVNPLKGDGLVLQVRSLEKLTLQIILSDGSNWVTYQLPIDASEESRILNIDWDKFNTNRGTFYEMNNGNLTLTVKAISNRATDDLQSLYIDNIGYYNYGEIYANYKLLHPDPVDDPSGNDTDPGTDTPDTGIQINLITILVLILSSCLTFGSLYMINYIKKDGYRHEK